MRKQWIAVLLGVAQMAVGSVAMASKKGLFVGTNGKIVPQVTAGGLNVIPKTERHWVGDLKHLDLLNRLSVHAKDEIKALQEIRFDLIGINRTDKGVFVDLYNPHTHEGVQVQDLLP